MWLERLREEPRVREALVELWPQALGILAEDLRPLLRERVAALDLPDAEPVERGEHSGELAELWETMTVVRRSVPGATW
jgi:1,2-phenylacetyl-CoA epoxidase catalytic subunit